MSRVIKPTPAPVVDVPEQKKRPRLRPFPYGARPARRREKCVIRARAERAGRLVLRVDVIRRARRQRELHVRAARRDADGANARALTKGDRNLYASPEWTPDGDYIVASKTGMPIGTVYDIWLYHKDGGAGASLTKDDKGPAPGPPGVSQKTRRRAPIRAASAADISLASMAAFTVGALLPMTAGSGAWSKGICAATYKAI